MKIVRSGAGQIVVNEWLKLACLNEHDAFRILDLAFDQQKWFFRYQKPHLFKKIGLNDGIGDTGFIFEADKNKTFRRPRALAANHIAGYVNCRARLSFG
jgi:hypothetical protein